MMQPRFERRVGNARRRWSSRRASAPASTSCACAPMPARSMPNWPNGGRTTRWAATKSARPCWRWLAGAIMRAARPAPAAAVVAGRRCRRRRRPGPQEAPAPPQAGWRGVRRCGRRRGRPGHALGRLSAGERAVTLAYVGLGANLGDARAALRGGVRSAVRAAGHAAAAPLVGLPQRADRLERSRLPERRGRTAHRAGAAGAARPPCRPSSWPMAASGPTATPRARWTSICCCTASACSMVRELTLPHPAAARARLRAAAAGRARARPAHSGARSPRGPAGRRGRPGHRKAAT